jgi:hypothetical protein
MGNKFMDERTTCKFNYTGAKGKQELKTFKNICNALAGNITKYL